MELRIKYIDLLVIASIIIVMGLFSSFVNKRYKSRKCTKVFVETKNGDDSNGGFVTCTDVERVITNDYESQVVGKTFKDISLKELKQKLRKQQYVEEAQIYRDFKGNLKIEIEPKKPIARIISNGMRDKYIGQNGEIFPVSTKYTDRVMLIGVQQQAFFQIENLKKEPLGEGLFELSQFIYNNEFWTNQIAEIHMDSKGKVEMYTHVGKQVIEFGFPENIEKKFIKLELFYKE